MKKSMPLISAKVNAPEVDEKYSEHRIKMAAEDMMRAEDHKKDPKMMEHVSRHLKGEHKKITSIMGLKKYKADKDKAKEGLASDNDMDEKNE